MSATHEVRLMCPSSKYGTAINAAGTYRVRCTGKFCKSRGRVTYHTFDLSTGMIVDTEYLEYMNPRELLGKEKI